MIQFVFFLVLGGFLTDIYCEGKRSWNCYSCDTDTNGLDCLYNPENVTMEASNTIPCEFFCNIERREYIHIPGSISIISLRRNCTENPGEDGVTAGDFFTTYYRSCRSNLCNSGDGIQIIEDVPDDPDEEEDSDENSSYGIHYYTTTIHIFKIYFFAFVAFIFSIT